MLAFVKRKRNKNYRHGIFGSLKERLVVGWSRSEQCKVRASQTLSVKKDCAKPKSSTLEELYSGRSMDTSMDL
jgi:hypothetical protein